MMIPKYEAMINANNETYLAETGTIKIDGRTIFNSPEKLADFFADSIGIRNAADEHVYVACLDTKCHMIGCFEASHGSVNASMFPVREIFQKSLMIGAVNIAICHNHPSGDFTPSNEDITATNRIVQGGTLLGVTVLDHIIVAANNYSYYSFCENGRI